MAISYLVRSIEKISKKAYVLKKIDVREILLDCEMV